MITESIIVFFIERISALANKIMESQGIPADIALPVPYMFWDYATYLFSQTMTVLPLMIAWWAWRQVKA